MPQSRDWTELMAYFALREERRQAQRLAAQQPSDEAPGPRRLGQAAR